MENHYSILNILKRGALTGTIFTCIWATWAYFANIEHGHAIVLKSAITQASFTIVNAFVFTVLMEFMFAYSKGKIQRLMLAFLLPNTMTASVLYSMHWYRDTPNILVTVLPSIFVIATLSLIYVLVVGPKKHAILIED